MSNLPNGRRHASGAVVNPTPPPKPTELSLGLSASVRIGSSRWFLRRIALYVDPFPAARWKATAYLEHRDTDRDPVAPRDPLAVELRGEGSTLAEAFAALAAQVIPACPLLQLGADADALRASLETCPDCGRHFRDHTGARGDCPEPLT